MASRTIRTFPQERTPIPEQDPAVRVTNFDEVALGYRLEDALNEMKRCLLCADPTSTGQPATHFCFLHCRQRLASVRACSSV